MALPNWPGADAVYLFITSHLERLALAEYRAGKMGRNGKRPKYVPAQRHRDAIEALNCGDEETLKALQAAMRFNEGEWS